MYLVKLTYQIKVDEHHDHEFDEQVRVLKASSEQSAFEKSRMLGRKNETSFINENGKHVTWKFIDVNELISLNEKNSGDELFTRSITTDCPETYIQSIKHQSMMLQLSKQTLAI